jgi:hypothetical protein
MAGREAKAICRTPLDKLGLLDSLMEFSIFQSKMFGTL